MASKPVSIEGNLQATIDALIAKLTCSDFASCRRARNSLIEIGKPGVPSLVMALEHPNQWVRWEAVKALGQIADTSCIEALVRTLEDEISDVRWAAVDELIFTGQRVFEPLLKALVNRPDSVWLREGAHKVLRNILKKADRDLIDILNPVLEALDGINPSTEVAPVAWNALEKLNQKTTYELAVK